MYLTKPAVPFVGKGNAEKVNLELSTKTDRKLNSKPLRSITIYLDIINSSLSLQKLTEEIEALGGIVETFLNKNVNYFVTNRRNLKQSNDSSGTPSSWNSMSRSSTMTADSPWTIEPLRCGTIKRAVKTRADALIEKAQKSVKYAGDVLQMAALWGIKIIHLSKFNIWLKNLKAQCKLDTISSTKKVISKFKLKHSSKTRLALPFFKYEDSERSFCPQYRQLQEWPVLHFSQDCDTSPFRLSVCKKNLKSLTPIPRSPLKPIPSLRKLNTTNDFHKKMNSTVQTELPKKPGYCEICGVRYTNINEHIVEVKHKKIVGETGFFSKLDGFIATLSTLKEIRDKFSTTDNNTESSTPINSKSSENVLKQNNSKVQYSLQHIRGGEYGTPRKKQKLDSGISLLSFVENNMGAKQEDKENLKEEIQGGEPVIRTPEKVPFQMKRNGLQQIRNATFCNPDISLNDLESNPYGAEGETLCILKNTPSRLLRSTSHRRTLSSNTSGDISGNSPTALCRNVLSKDAITAFNDDTDNTNCTSLWNQFEPLNLSTKLSLESLAIENENEGIFKCRQHDEIASNFNPEFNSPAIYQHPIQDDHEDDLKTALENYTQSVVGDELMKDEDNNWESAIDSFISSKLKSIQSESDGMNISANLSPKLLT